METRGVGVTPRDIAIHDLIATWAVELTDTFSSNEFIFADKHHKERIVLQFAKKIIMAAAATWPPEHKACPCLHTTPCDAYCTCVQPLSSRGCARCCTYGSPEQQRNAAEYIASKLGTRKELMRDT